jgi:hypothetical protein
MVLVFRHLEENGENVKFEKIKLHETELFYICDTVESIMKKKCCLLAEVLV